MSVTAAAADETEVEAVAAETLAVTLPAAAFAAARAASTAAKLGRHLDLLSHLRLHLILHLPKRLAVVPCPHTTQPLLLPNLFCSFHLVP